MRFPPVGSALCLTAIARAAVAGTGRCFGIFQHPAVDHTRRTQSFRIRQATTRATDFESDLDEFRLIVEYPLEVL